MYALIDCNNFYASCERLFRPDLYNKALLVLSNNDGCIIARSNEAKALGFKMGEAYFKVRALCQAHQVQVFSSNYSLYGDISLRVMSIIEQAWPSFEIYSIDEAFLDLSSLAPSLRASFCLDLQKKILKEIGIPTSIGIGASKTLAKAANHVAKKILKIPVVDLSQKPEPWLKQMAVQDVWGIGQQWAKQLGRAGIHTAYDLAEADTQVLKNVLLIRSKRELQGISCRELVEVKPKQSIISSKSFGRMQTSLSSISEALSSHCLDAFKKLRQHQRLAQGLSVFVQTNRFREDLAQHCQSIAVQFTTPTDDLRRITHSAKQGLEQLFKPGYIYKKVGLCLEHLIEKAGPRQLNMFQTITKEDLEKTECLMSTLEDVHQKFGKQSLYLAACGQKKTWAMRSQLKSPAYTTKWSDLAPAMCKKP